MSKPVFSDLFTASGRRNRKSYFLYGLAVTIILGIVWGVAMGASHGEPGLGVVVASIISILFVVASCFVSAQRCRDFGWTGWAVLITLLPFVGWIFSVAMLFIPGTDGPNRYGPDPLAADLASNPVLPA